MSEETKYRLLENGEKIREGDEYYNRSIWAKVSSSISDIQQEINTPKRRKNTSEVKEGDVIEKEINMVKCPSTSDEWPCPDCQLTEWHEMTDWEMKMVDSKCVDDIELVVVKAKIIVDKIIKKGGR